MHIKNIMSVPVLARAGLTAGEAVREMCRSRGDCLVLVDEGGRPMGILGTGKLLEYTCGHGDPDHPADNLAR